MDDVEFQSAVFQRPFQYLQRFAQQKKLRGVEVNVPHGTPEQCITTLLQYGFTVCFFYYLRRGGYAFCLCSSVNKIIKKLMVITL